MRRPPGGSRSPLARLFLATALLAKAVLGAQILTTNGFSDCGTNTSLSVTNVNINYNNDNKTVTFNVAGTSTIRQYVTAILNVTAYGTQIYSNAFDPCESSTFVQQLCPIPSGSFSAQGTQAIPSEYADLVPAIAFDIPDIAATATMQLLAKNSSAQVGCFQSQVTNGKTVQVPAVPYVAAAVAGIALALSGASVLGGAFSSASGAATGGVGAPSPSFFEVFGWFQGMAMNGMLSVDYPQVYRSFSTNFAFSTGLVSWARLQMAIDDFRAGTGGNLTQDSVQFLQNATLVFPDGSSVTPGAGSSSSLKLRRATELFAHLVPRSSIVTSINTTMGASSSNSSSSSGGGSNMAQTVRVAVSGFKAFAEELSIPSANTFMTVLLIVAIVIAVVVVSILLVKVALETWALYGNFPQSLAGFRKHYWGSIARAITTLILLLYGVWVVYCLFQFTQGDSWAAKALAGVTLTLFTGILAFFSYRIWSTARWLTKADGDVSALYEDKSIWVKYSLFYESYRKNYWWIFVPTIAYLFAKGCILALADGHGMIQVGGQLIVESLMLILLLWSRPYERRSGNVVNIIIQVVRVLSIVCVLLFVDELGIQETTKTVAGFVLVAVQSALTGVLALLIAWNALAGLCRQNPHRKRRKEMEKIRTNVDTLTPLDARNSLFLGGKSPKVAMHLNQSEDSLASMPTATDVITVVIRGDEKDSSTLPIDPAAPGNAVLQQTTGTQRSWSPVPSGGGGTSSENLVLNAAPMGLLETRQPTIPNVGTRPSYSLMPQTMGCSQGGYGQGGYGQGRGGGEGGGHGGVPIA